MDWNSSRVTSLLDRALLEDHALADTTTALTVEADQLAQGEIVAKQECVLAGLPLLQRIFDQHAELSRREAQKNGGHPLLPPTVVSSHPEIFDGVRLHPGQTVAVIRGLARTLLSCERLSLNLLQRMCGIATLTREFVDAVKGLPVHILDTRKTAPGMRALDKYAVTCGGGVNHRSDLSAAILIKNNHIRLAGGIGPALARARAGLRPQQVIEIEVRSLEEVSAALAGGAERLLLDNMTPAQVRAAVELVAGRVPVEVSGGVGLATVRAYAEAGPQFISVGALTHSAPAVDLSMRIVSIDAPAHSTGPDSKAATSAPSAA